MQQQEIETLLKPMLERLEPQRQQVRKKIWYNIILGIPQRILAIAATFVVLYFLSQFVEHHALSLFLYVLFYPIALIIGATYTQVTKKNILLAKEFEDYIKTELFTSIFKKWNASIKYSPSQGIDQATFNLVGTKTDYNTYSGDDYCTGTLEDGRTFQFSEITQLHITGKEADAYNPQIQRSLLLILEDSLLLKEHSAPIRISSNALVPAIKTNKLFKKASPKHLEAILDAEPTTPTTNQETTIPLGPNFQLESLHTGAIAPLLTEEWKQDLQYLNQVLRNDLVLLSQKGICYLWVQHKSPFWEVPIKTPLTDGVLRKTLAWNFARCFLLVTYLAKLTQKST